MEEPNIFSRIYKTNFWGSPESRSGTGSEQRNTKVIKRELIKLFSRYKITTMLDIPCGDFNWMKEVYLQLDEYIGADIVPELVADNKRNYPDCDFRVLDITKDELPSAELIFVRDLFVHFSLSDIKLTLGNICRGGFKYLLTTSFVNRGYNTEIQTGYWRPINLMMEPFNLTPIYMINEDCKEGNGAYKDKCLLLFKVDEVPSL